MGKGEKEEYGRRSGCRRVREIELRSWIFRIDPFATDSAGLFPDALEYSKKEASGFRFELLPSESLRASGLALYTVWVRGSTIYD